MNTIECGPFSGRIIDKLGKKGTSDSVVMLCHNKSSREFILKWNKSLITTPEEATEITTFTKNSIKLYEEVLGKEYIVPTDLAIGEKIDGNKRKIKVYEMQPYINSWDGHTLPEDLRKDGDLIGKWKILYKRLSILYLVGHRVNKEFAEQGKIKFPVNITVGNSRNSVLSKVFDFDYSTEIPATSNILIDRTNLDLHLCDFGPYTAWEPRMEEAYLEILNRSALEIMHKNAERTLFVASLASTAV